MSRTIEPAQTPEPTATLTDPVERNRTLYVISSLLLLAGELIALFEAVQRLRKTIARRRQYRQLTR